MISKTQNIRLIALPQVVSISGIGKSEIFRRIKKRAFPAPIRLGEGCCSRWNFREVQDWLFKNLAERAVLRLRLKKR